MATAKTWLWIILGVIGVCILGIIGLAGAGAYFFASHIESKVATSAVATQRFDEVRARFKGQTPILRMDNFDRPTASGRVEDLPASSTKPQSLYVLVWDDDEERLTNISVPFWLLRLGGRKMNLASGPHDLDLRRLNLSVEQLERIGPRLILDHASPSGQRVLIWTQ